MMIKECQLDGTDGGDDSNYYKDFDANLRTISKRVHKDVNAAKIILHSFSNFLADLKNRVH